MDDVQELARHHRSPRGADTLHVSLPIPVFPPVTMTTFPVKSGTSSAVNSGFGAK